METGATFAIRRARPTDAEQIADFVSRAHPNHPNLAPTRMMERFGNVGFLLAEQDGRMLGLIGWYVEDLVACVTDLLIWPARERGRVGEALMRSMHVRVAELQAEAILLPVPPSRRSDRLRFFELFDYRLRKVAELPEAWRKVALHWDYMEEDVVPVKQLRTGLVDRPL